MLGPSGILRDKARLVITHQLQYTPEADVVFLLGKCGRVLESSALL